MTLLYVESRVCVTRISTYGGKDRATEISCFHSITVGLVIKHTFTFTDGQGPYGIPRVVETFNQGFDPILLDKLWLVFKDV
jgi:hypothetical protein